MIVNIILGFIIPWALSLIILKKNIKIIIIFAPFASMVAFMINDIGTSLGFWDLEPIINEDESASALPLNLGTFPAIACLMLYLLLHSNINRIILIISTSIFLATVEAICKAVGYCHYSNGWNIFYTFLSYLTALLLVYLYEQFVIKLLSISN